MSVTYVCPSCGAKMAVDSQVDAIRCPVCRVAMEPGDSTASGDSEPKRKTGKVATPSRVAAPFKGLKVARPVRNLGEPDVPVEGAGSSVPDAASETHTFPAGAAGGGDLAKEMEKIVAAARRQAQQEAELIRERARVDAQKETDDCRREARAALENELADLRRQASAEARQAAEDIVAKARQKAEESAAAIRAEAERAGRESAEAIRAAAIAEAEEAREAVVAEARKLAGEARRKARTLREDARKEARECVKQATEKARKNLLDQAEKVAEAARRKGREQAEELIAEARLNAAQIVQEARQQAETAGKRQSAERREEEHGAQENANTAAADTKPSEAQAEASPESTHLEEENRRLKKSLERQTQDSADAKESAYRDANLAHTLQFRISLLLRLTLPLLLLYGLFMVAKAQGPAWKMLAGIFFVIALGLSIWGLLLGRRLKKHIDGLFEFFFKEHLRNHRRDGDDGGSKSASLEQGKSKHALPTAVKVGKKSPKSIRVKKTAPNKALSPTVGKAGKEDPQPIPVRNDNDAEQGVDEKNGGKQETSAVDESVSAADRAADTAEKPPLKPPAGAAGERERSADSPTDDKRTTTSVHPGPRAAKADERRKDHGDAADASPGAASAKTGNVANGPPGGGR